MSLHAYELCIRTYTITSPNRDARQHRSDWTAQDPSRYPPSYSQQLNSSYISYTDTTFPGAAQALPFAYLLVILYLRVAPC